VGRLFRNIDVSGWDISDAEWPRIHTWGVALKITGTVPKAWKLRRGAFMYSGDLGTLKTYLGWILLSVQRMHMELRFLYQTFWSYSTVAGKEIIPVL
jgi:hypothetical protein